ncbi:sigma factor-like helix-turn-helix DNA-binding protein [Streptomyces canus]|uniref:sigma factor-like helix-turn-helix DNA-binding protein n=1 Tax=Streptomyces canus TaxID=58343 RepID=UPI0007C82C4F|nr:sigma factor-like helix-turn-helix DNA-binding protein [Streptomyces canus]
MDQADDAVPIAEMLDERQQLLDVACWMLGTGPGADEVVTETYRRWYGLSDPERARIAEPLSWLVKTAGAICLTYLALPERRDPGAAGTAGDTTMRTCPSLADEVSEVLLNALDSLSPAERAAFVLNDVFGMAPQVVAEIVGRTERECAELAERARHTLRIRRSSPTKPEQHDRMVRTVREACAAEDSALLSSLLAPDAMAFFDGGGKVRALVRPVHGALKVARSLLTLLSPRPRTALDLHSVNGRTGIVVRYDGQVAAVISFDTAGHHVVQVWAVLNPDKLRLWNRPDASSGVPRVPGVPGAPGGPGGSNNVSATDRD